MKIKTVVFGAGKMGRNHVRTVQASSRFELVGVVDPALPPVQGAPCVKTMEELPAAFDLAIVATPTASHYELGKKLLRAGKHVLMEKPLASTSKQALELAELARSLDKRFAVGHVERFNPAVHKLAEVIQSQILGKPIHFSFTRIGGYPQTVVDANDVILDLAVHDVDVFSSLCGDCTLVASQTHITTDRGVVDTATMLLRSASGVTADIHTNWITPSKIRQIRVTGTSGVCFVDYIMQTCEMFGGNLLTRLTPPDTDFAALRTTYANADKIHFGVETKEPLVLQLEQLARFIEHGETGRLCLADRAAATVAIAEAARVSTKPS
jgi:UDP-N-acetylglucosamine 3-dehydrogenase